MTRSYKLLCQSCDKTFEDDGFMLDCDGEHQASLLIAEYAADTFTVDRQQPGMYRYHSWLPIVKNISGSSGTVTYQSKSLSQLTGLPFLWISFNGYWPEKGVKLETTTFKELEAYTVLSRLPEGFDDVLVVSSAGNTASAFAYICSQQKQPCLIILPESGLARMQFTESLDPCVKIVCLTGNVDYYDAIVLANRVAQREGFVLEGGVKNVARRAGLGVTMLNAVETIGRLPDYYFQAVGSGAGGIAVHEMARCLMKDTRFGNRYPRLMLGQNKPFAPIYHSWKAKRSSLIELSSDEGKRQIQSIVSKVLSNQKPPYAVRGGVFDVLVESQGDMLAASNQEIQQAMNTFYTAEGIDIDPAAGVAFATLLSELRASHIDRDAVVLLNVTGGGWEHKRAHCRLIPASPALRICDSELASGDVMDRIMGLF
ncbi:cysteate synthase [Ktedonobacter robiniae]